MGPIPPTAKESGLSEEYIKKTEQMKSTSFLYGLYMSAQQLPMNGTPSSLASRSPMARPPEPYSLEMVITG